MDAYTALSLETPLEDLKKGFAADPGTSELVCLLCGERFRRGVIYRSGEELVDAELAVNRHIRDSHVSVFRRLLSLDRKFNGVSDVQKEILQLLSEGKTDAEAAKLLGKAASTVRNHRFQLRERYREARLFVALMDLFDAGAAETLVEYPASLTVRDERAVSTEAERDAVVNQYFPDSPAGALARFPKQQKKKLIILNHITGRFEDGKTYTEREVNDILRPVYSDYVTIRRYLIEYGFLDRKPDCSAYWKP